MTSRVRRLWPCRLGPSMSDTDINCDEKGQVDRQLAGHAKKIKTSKVANKNATEKANMQFIKLISVSLQHFIKNIIENTNIVKG